jgi:hypothetical protein
MWLPASIWYREAIERVSYSYHSMSLFCLVDRIVLLLSYTECHDRVDYVVAIVFQSFDGLLPTDISL